MTACLAKSVMCEFMETLVWDRKYFIVMLTINERSVVTTSQNIVLDGLLGYEPEDVTSIHIEPTGYETKADLRKKIKPQIDMSIFPSLVNLESLYIAGTEPYDLKMLPKSLKVLTLCVSANCSLDLPELVDLTVAAEYDTHGSYKVNIKNCGKLRSRKAADGYVTIVE